MEAPTAPLLPGKSCLSAPIAYVRARGSAARRALAAIGRHLYRTFYNLTSAAGRLARTF
jgi:hypothetical protein